MLLIAMKNFSVTGTYTDLYQLTMGQVYYLKGKSQAGAVFDYFFRKIPFEGGYVVFAGLGTILEILEDLQFTNDEIAFYDVGVGTEQCGPAALTDHPQRFRGSAHNGFTRLDLSANAPAAPTHLRAARCRSRG